MPPRNHGAGFLLAALLVAAVVGAYGPLLVEFCRSTWQRAHYQHFPFVVLAGALLASQRFAFPREGRPPAIGWAWGMAIAAWVLLAVGYQIPSPLFATASLILLVAAAGIAFARRAEIPFPWGAWGLLWLVLPPPLGLDYKLVSVLQHASSRLASLALDVLGVEHLMEGNALVVGGRTLFVDEACSGIVSAVSIVSCAAMYAVWRRRGLAHGVLLMAAAAGWATMTNVLRIVSIALAEVLAGLDWAEGPAHTAVGLGAFGFSLLALVATDWLLNALLAEVGPRWELLTSEPIRFGQRLVDLWDRAVATRESSARRVSGVRDWRGLVGGSLGVSATLIASIAFGGLGATQLIRSAVLAELDYSFPASQRFADRLKAGAMPNELDDLRLVEIEHRQREDDSVFGANSVIFHYQRASGERFLVSCDFPFVGGWHDISGCYVGIGWQLEARANHERPTPEGVPFDAAQFDLTKPDGMAALVTMCACYHDGDPLDAPVEDSLLTRLGSVLTRRDVAADTRRLFQVQVLAERSGRIARSDRAVSWRLLEVARSRFVAQIRRLSAEDAAPAEPSPE